ncbi:hypothetical protein HMPREF9022_03356 [Erysipelotrichaceae bacterium 2_2_44A]|nr:hypothetical protein HMPREF9022_03356 [Erysipelotrichaceae bacterium 2_2_44A]
MIIQIRVDDRLIHGQIAVVWSKHFATNHLVVANDQAAKKRGTADDIENGNSKWREGFDSQC